MHGQHEQTLAGAPVDKYSFDTGKRTLVDAYPLPRLHVWVRRSRQLGVDEHADGVDFRVRNFSRSPVLPSQHADQPARLEQFDVARSAEFVANEEIPRKQRPSDSVFDTRPPGPDADGR